MPDNITMLYFFTGEVERLLRDYKQNQDLVRNLGSRYYQVVYPIQVRHREMTGVSTREADAFNNGVKFNGRGVVEPGPGGEIPGVAGPVSDLPRDLSVVCVCVFGWFWAAIKELRSRDNFRPPARLLQRIKGSIRQKNGQKFQSINGRRSRVSLHFVLSCPQNSSPPFFWLSTPIYFEDIREREK